MRRLIACVAAAVSAAFGAWAGASVPVSLADVANASRLDYANGTSKEVHVRTGRDIGDWTSGRSLKSLLGLGEGTKGEL